MSCLCALCVDVRRTASIGQYREDLRVRSREPGLLKYPGASHTQGHLIWGYQQSDYFTLRRLYTWAVVHRHKDD